METFIQYIITVLSLGGVYALLALGLATVFGLIGFLNFAHGDLMTVCGYTMYFAIASGIPFPLAAALGVLVAALAAVLMERVAFRPLRGKSPMTLLITSFAIALALHVSFQVFISPKPKPIPIPSYLAGYYTMGGIFISKAQIISIIGSVAAMVGLSYFVTHTRIGNNLRATAADFDVARAMGIRSNKMVALAFSSRDFLPGSLR